MKLIAKDINDTIIDTLNFDINWNLNINFLTGINNNEIIITFFCINLDNSENDFSNFLNLIQSYNNLNLIFQIYDSLNNLVFNNQILNCNFINIIINEEDVLSPIHTGFSIKLYFQNTI